MLAACTIFGQLNLEYNSNLERQGTSADVTSFRAFKYGALAPPELAVLLLRGPWCPRAEPCAELAADEALPVRSMSSTTMGSGRERAGVSAGDDDPHPIAVFRSPHWALFV